VNSSKLGTLRPRAPQPPAPLAEHDAQVDVLPLDVHALDLQRVQPPARTVDPLTDLAPAGDRVLNVEKASVDDLLPVLLDAHPRLGGHRRRPVEAERPAEAARVLLLAAPIQQRAHGRPLTHDLRRIDRVERMRVGVGEHRDLVVHLVDQAAHVSRVEVVELLVTGQLEEVA
jgi:hypothetical protein